LNTNQLNIISVFACVVLSYGGIVLASIPFHSISSKLSRLSLSLDLENHIGTALGNLGMEREVKQRYRKYKDTDRQTDRQSVSQSAKPNFFYSAVITESKSCIYCAIQQARPTTRRWSWSFSLLQPQSQPRLRMIGFACSAFSIGMLHSPGLNLVRVRR
jgi:hypothetical protein